MKHLAIFLLILFFSVAASADEEFTCTRGEVERIISVVYPGDGPLPCEVRYDKGDGVEVLWSSEHTEGYCERNAREFVEKQKDWGYKCAQQ